MKRLLAQTLLLLSLTAAVFADTVPSTMTFQGRLAKPDGTPLADTNTQQLTFRLFANQTGGTALWTQTTNNVAVHNGTFAVKLNFSAGFASGQNLSGVFANPPYLEVQIGSNAPLTPRQPYNAVAYAFVANSALTVPDGSISSNKIANNAITNAKIAHGAVSLNKLDPSLQQTLAPVNGLTQKVGLGLAARVRTAGSPYFLTTSGNYAYVTNPVSKELQIFNISDPTNPTLTGSVGTNNLPHSVAVSGNYAYVVNYNSYTLQIFNVSNPANPILVGNTNTTSVPTSVTVFGNYAYVLSANDVLQVFNVSNPANPTFVTQVGTGGTPYCITISGHHAYVVNYSSNTLQVFNIDNPANPTLAGSVGTGVYPISIAISGNYAYVVNQYSDSMQVFNISDPAHPTLAGQVGTDYEPYDVAVSGNYAYVVNSHAHTIQVFNVSNPANPTLAGHAGTDFYPYSVAVSGNYAYVANWGASALQVFQTTTLQIPANLKVLGSIHATGNISVGTTSPTAPLHLKGTESDAEVKFGGLGGDVHHLSSARDLVFNSKLGTFIFRNTPDFNDLTSFTDMFTILGNGNAILAGTLTQNSDSRYKTNIHTFENGLDAILQLRGVTYDWDTQHWKNRPFPEGRQIGFIAQEVEKVLPELVSTDKNGYKSVAYQNLVPVLVEAVKTLKQDNDALKAQLAALMQAVQQLQNKHK
jgi:hypothetical protein